MEKGLKDWFPVFKAGTHTDSAGNTHKWTTDDLDKIVENYSEDSSDFQEAPCVLGHPKTDDPAYGWVAGLKRVGNILYAKCKDLVGEFEDMVKDGLYPNRSIALTPDLRLRHIGFLGAVPPAVKGLGKIAFSSEEDLLTFSTSQVLGEINYKLRAIGGLFQKMREFLIEKYGLEATDNVLESWDINNLLNTNINTDEGRVAFCQKFMEGLTLNTTTDKTQSAGEFSQADMDAKNQEIANLKAEKAKLEAEANKKEFSDFCDDLIAKGKMLPAQKAQAVEFMELAQGIGEFEFAEGGTAPAIDKVKAYLESTPEKSLFSEQANGGGSDEDLNDPKKLAEKAKEFQASELQKGRTISYEAAVLAVSSEQ